MEARFLFLNVKSSIQPIFCRSNVAGDVHVYPATWRNVYKCFDGARRRVVHVSWYLLEV